MSSVSAFIIVPIFATVNNNCIVDLMSCGCYFREYKYYCMWTVKKARWSIE